VSPAGAEIEAVATLSAAARADVRRLAEAATSADGVYPLNDQVTLDVDSDKPAPVRHLLARRTSSGVIGYAHLDERSPDAAAGHLVVHPDARRAGVGSALLAALTSAAGTGPVRVWAHGDLEPARSLARSAGWRRARELRKMLLRRSHPIAEPEYPDGVRVRTFRPGADEDGWVAVNAAAFRDHPEQGRMTAADLVQRERQTWFDADGFFIAERGGEVVGSHWTKVHRAAEDGESEVGEVYVVGVRPDQQGSGLGRALTLTGLQHLRARGLDVILYVDADNAAAVRVYERIGFEIASVDVMYEQPPA
jgi:mycothiol synthase